jgi:hypothetical protein
MSPLFGRWRIFFYHAAEGFYANVMLQAAFAPSWFVGWFSN